MNKTRTPAAKDGEVTSRDSRAVKKGTLESKTERELLEVPNTPKGIFDIVVEQNRDRASDMCEQKIQQRELSFHNSNDFIDDPTVPPLI